MNQIIGNRYNFISIITQQPLWVLWWIMMMTIIGCVEAFRFILPTNHNQHHPFTTTKSFLPTTFQQQSNRQLMVPSLRLLADTTDNNNNNEKEEEEEYVPSAIFHFLPREDTTTTTKATTSTSTTTTTTSTTTTTTTVVDDQENTNNTSNSSWEESFSSIVTQLTSTKYESIPHAIVAMGKQMDDAASTVIMDGNDNDNDNDDDDDDDEVVWMAPMAQRVEGCIATVYIRIAIVRQKHKQSNGGKLVVSLQHNMENTADALISRGLMSILHTLFMTTTNHHHHTPSDILQLNPDTLADQLQIRSVLSPGRNDGLASMMRQIQQQIQLYLHPTTQPSPSLPDSSSSSTTATSQDKEEIVKDEAINHQNDSLVRKEEKEEEEGPIRVAMLLSGGVDSSVALALLASQPEKYNVTAFYLKIWLDEELGDQLGQQCPWEDDVGICQDVCTQLNIPLEIVSLSDQYHQRVISYTLEEAQKGRTPNPDIMCNSRIKFGTFYDYAIHQCQFQYIASGHYAQNLQTSSTIIHHHESKNKSSSSNVYLCRSPDPVKDQSYFLSALTPTQLSKILFPIGHYEKHQVRELAQDTYQLPNRYRPDSQGLCFLGKVKFDDFLHAYLGKNPGPILDVLTGQTIGQHAGLWYHTVGQRKGLGKALQPKMTSQGPWYVVAKNPSTNTLFVSNQYEQSDEFTQPRSEFTVDDISWITPHLPPFLEKDGKTMRLDMKIRHGPNIVAGTLTLNYDPHTNNDDTTTTTTTTQQQQQQQQQHTGSIKLDVKDGGLAPGQFVAFYRLNDLECLGSGVISEHHWSSFLSQQQFKKDEEEKTTTTLIE